MFINTFSGKLAGLVWSPFTVKPNNNIHPNNKTVPNVRVDTPDDGLLWSLLQNHVVIVVGGEGKTICLLLPAFVRNELEIWTSQCNVKRYRAPIPNVSPKHIIMIIKTENKKRKKGEKKSM